MVSGIGFEAMKSSNPEFSWKTVTKGRRTRKSMGRSTHIVAKTGHSPSPTRVGEFSGSDSDKFGESITEQLNRSCKSGSVPIKKRRHLLQAPSTHTQTSSRCLEREYNVVGDFSGIELLAAAASMDDDSDNATNVELDVGHSLILENSNATNSASQCELGLKRGDSESSATTTGGNTGCLLVRRNPVTVSQNPCENSVDMMTITKVDRRHWDLNTLMDSWDDPYDDSIAGNTANDMHMEDMRVDGSNTAQEVSDLDNALVNDVQKGISDQVMNIDATVDSSPSVKLYSSMVMVEGKLSSISVNDAMNGCEVCSGNASDSERTTSSVIQAGTRNTTEDPMPACEISESASDFQCEDTRYSLKCCESPGATIEDGQSVLPSDSRIQNHGAFAPYSAIADFQGQVEPAELVVKHNLPDEGSLRIVLEDSCKSSFAPAQCDVDPNSSTGKIGSSLDAQHDPDVSQNNNSHAVGVCLTKCQDSYDSPYEDGELRGSFLYSWEDNELNDECVDYESDGRDGDGSDAIHSVTVEGGSDGSSGDAPRRSSFANQVHEDYVNDSGLVKQNLSKNFVKDDSDNNKIAGKGSTAGSGNTVEKPFKRDIKENDGIMERRNLIDKRDKAHMYKYASKAVRGKLQSRIGGWSSLDPTDGKDAFMQERRPQHFRLLYSQPERGTDPGKHISRYRPSTHGGRNGVHHPTCSVSRRQYSSSFQGAEDRSYARPRNIIGDSDKIGGFGFHVTRQTEDYFSEGSHRPLERSPDEGDGYFGMQRRRMSSTQGAGNSRRSRGSYLHRGRTDYPERLEPLPDEANIPVHYLSTRERIFSPNSGISGHIPSPYKRYRSKSRTRSPGPWHSHREHSLSTRRRNRSPDFRPEARMDRKRLAFSKPSFTHDFDKGYISPSRGRLSPSQQNCRWVDDGAFAENHSGNKRSPVGMFRCKQTFDVVGSSGRLNSDEYFTPRFRSERFSFMTNGGRDCKLASNYDDKRHHACDEMVHRPNSNDN